MIYIYADHLYGELYYLDDYEVPETCEQCGESDEYFGAVKNKSDARHLLYTHAKGYNKKYVNDFINKIKFSEA